MTIKSFSSTFKRNICLTKKGIPVCSNEGRHSFPRGDNYKNLSLCLFEKSSSYHVEITFINAIQLTKEKTFKINHLFDMISPSHGNRSWVLMYVNQNSE